MAPNEMPNISYGPQRSFRTRHCWVNPQWSLSTFWGQLFYHCLPCSWTYGKHPSASTPCWDSEFSLKRHLLVQDLFSGSCYCSNLNPSSSTNLLILQTYLGIPMSFLTGAWPGKGTRHRAPPWPMKMATNSLTFLPLKDKIYIPTSCMWAGFMTALNNILQQKSHCDFLSITGPGLH